MIGNIVLFNSRPAIVTLRADGEPCLNIFGEGGLELSHSELTAADIESLPILHEARSTEPRTVYEGIAAVLREKAAESADESEPAVAIVDNGKVLVGKGKGKGK